VGSSPTFRILKETIAQLNINKGGLIYFSLYSTVVVRRTCNAKVGGSIPPGGIYYCDNIMIYNIMSFTN
jgi:hypothetical protein